jgi:hypothetical protein
MRSLFLSILAMNMLFSINSFAQICSQRGITNTSDNRYHMLSNGSVIDYATNLMWMRCAVGQIWNGQICVGETTRYTYPQALQAVKENNFLDKTDWRIPTIQELQSLVATDCSEPAINLKAFPSTATNDFWSLSPSVVEGNIWFTNFANGSSRFDVMNSQKSIRFVRDNTDITTVPVKLGNLNLFQEIVQAKLIKAIAVTNALKYAITQCLYDNNGAINLCNSYGYGYDINYRYNLELAKYGVRPIPGMRSMGFYGYSSVPADANADWESIYVGNKAEIVIKGSGALGGCNIGLKPHFNLTTKIVEWKTYSYRSDFFYNGDFNQKLCAKLVNGKITHLLLPTVGGNTPSN